MPLAPPVYASLLGAKIARHQVDCWLINTGWSGGPFGTGSRIRIAHTRAMIRAALDGALAAVPMVSDPLFGLNVPSSCPEVPPEVLSPRNTWTDTSAYDATARQLADAFRKNFKQFEDSASEAVRRAGPQS
jgi:phosphoenolpyruvate carboxykinase (ATP)